MLNNAADQAKLLENLTRLVDRIEENELQDYFPSAHERAKKAIANHQSPATETQQPAAQNPLLENLARLVDRVEDFKLQDHFPSTYRRAKEALASHAEQKDRAETPLPDLYKGNFYRNWHRPSSKSRVKRNELCNLWPVRLHKDKLGGAEITFTAPYGEQITFFLTEETFQKLKRDILK